MYNGSKVHSRCQTHLHNKRVLLRFGWILRTRMQKALYALCHSMSASSSSEQLLHQLNTTVALGRTVRLAPFAPDVILARRMSNPSADKI